MGEGEEARHLHGDGRHRRGRGQALQDHPRDAGRVLAGEPAAHRAGPAGGLLQGRARADAGRAAASWTRRRARSPARKTSTWTRTSATVPTPRSRACSRSSRTSTRRAARAPSRAGNSSQLSDGASATLLMSADRAKALGIKPKLIFRGFAVAGCEPDEMGIGPDLRGAEAAQAQRPQDGRHRRVGAERGLRLAGRLLPRQAGHSDGEAQRRTAARSRSATPSA